MNSKPVTAMTHDEVMWVSFKKGMGAFVATGVPAFGLSYYLHRTNATFRTKFAPSAKIGLPLMATLFMGSLYFELTMFDAHRNPENWSDGEKVVVAAKPQKAIPLHNWVLNRIHDKPFYFATMMALPLAGSILYGRMKEPHLTVSQALLQSRVMAQFGVLAIVLTTLGVRVYVDNNGKYPEEEE